MTGEKINVDWEEFRRALQGEYHERDERGRWHPVPVETLNDQVISQALTAADRCDRCGAEAWVRWVRDNQHILTCAHHARSHEEALLEWAHYSIDKRRDRFAVDARVSTDV